MKRFIDFRNNDTGKKQGPDFSGPAVLIGLGPCWLFSVNWPVSTWQDVGSADSSFKEHWQRADKDLHLIWLFKTPLLSKNVG